MNGPARPRPAGNKPLSAIDPRTMARGQVENQVGVIRRRLFVPRPRFKSCAELNDEPCRAVAGGARTVCGRLPRGKGFFRVGHLVGRGHVYGV